MGCIPGVNKKIVEINNINNNKSKVSNLNEVKVCKLSLIVKHTSIAHLGF